MKSLRLLCAMCLVLGCFACGGDGGGNDPAALGGRPSYTLSGVATVSSGFTADSDVNDPDAPFVDNNSPETAQIVFTPGSIVGFASIEGSGLPGSRFATSADEFDAYRVVLTSGQLVRLEVSGWNDKAPSAIDLDLYLYNVDLNLIASSEGNGAVESLTVPTNGEFFVVVQAYAGASNYRISIGMPGATVSAANRLSRLDDFLPGETIVTPKNPVLRPMALQATRADAIVTAGGVGQPLLVRLNEVKVMAAQSKPVQSYDRWSGRPVTTEMAAKTATIKAVKDFRASPEIASAGPNYILKALSIPNDPLYVYQWHFPMIKLPEAWNITSGSRDSSPVIVAVIDTGVVLSHPDLQGQLVAGYDFIRDPNSARDGDGIDPNPDDPGDLDNQNMSSWHGTHVSGTIAARTDNGVGVAGVAGGVKIMPIRVLGIGGGSTYDVLQGIRFAGGLTNDSGTVPAQRAEVINLSLGGPGFDQATADAIAAVRGAGVIVVAAAGNENSANPSYPAGFNGVISVSAVDIGGKRTSYSNYGATIDVAAPGGYPGYDSNKDGYTDEILSTFILESDGGKQYDYQGQSGTSMAAAHVSGVVALMKAVAPALTPVQFDSLLANGSLTNDIGNAGRDDLYGHGLLNAYKAIVAAQAQNGAPTNPPLLSSTPTRLDFGFIDQYKTITINNVGDGNLAVSDWSVDTSWLSITPTTVDGDGLGLYEVIVNRSGLSPGTHTAVIVFVSSAGSCNIPVTLDVAGGAQSGNAGRVYFVLVDSRSEELKYQDKVNPNGGDYPFSFSAVVAGDYWLIAGSDANNDGYICDAGEYCGVWPLLGELGTISVANSRGDLTLNIEAPWTFLTSATVSRPEWRGYALRPENSPNGTR